MVEKVHVGAESFRRYLEDLVGREAVVRIAKSQFEVAKTICGESSYRCNGLDVINNGKQVVRSAFSVSINSENDIFGLQQYLLRDYGLDGEFIEEVSRFQAKNMKVPKTLFGRRVKDSELAEKIKNYSEFQESVREKVAELILDIPVIYLPMLQKDIPGFNFEENYEILATGKVFFYNGKYQHSREPMKSIIAMHQERAYKMRGDAVVIDSSNCFVDSEERPCAIIRVRKE